ncbi:MAG: efflux RND transporter periplasmic adaptor subunit [Chroococcidiopsidaceae cyanobacterium CP_BM_RX_35]|nr:efflux RND transporter periplasmic adaptor subunit [Chroococcidiopsidaceae cyanobacterium CP_BM_RX_35]
MAIKKFKATPIFPKLLLLGVSCGSLLLLAACQASSSTPANTGSSPAPVRLPIVSVQRQDLPVVVSLPGTVSALPSEAVKVSPVVPGRIIAIPVVPGQRVRRGQVIAQLDSQQLKEQLSQANAAVKVAEHNVAQAQANLVLATSNLGRYHTLYQQGVVSQPNFVTYQNQAAVAQSQLAANQSQVKQALASRSQALTQLKYTEVRSPISGIVANQLLQVGDTAAGAGASPSTPVLEIVNLDTVMINSNLPADQPANIHVNQSAQIRSVALPGVTFDGRVTAVSPVVDPRSNTLNIQIRTPNPSKQLKVGQVVGVSIATGVHDGALTVPQTALVPDPKHSQGKMVYTIRAGKAQPIQVKTGIERNGQVEILSGLQAGETVVAKGAYGLPDGTPIEAVAEAKQ